MVIVINYSVALIAKGLLKPPQQHFVVNHETREIWAPKKTREIIDSSDFPTAKKVLHTNEVAVIRFWTFQGVTIDGLEGFSL